MVQEDHRRVLRNDALRPLERRDALGAVGRWDRAKVDWNRDEVDDEKLNVKNGVLERKDEKSGQIKVFGNGAWTVKAP